MPVGLVGDSYDNALAETINGLYKAEVIHRRGPWRSFEAVEFATLEWVDWFNNRRLLEPIGNIPPAEAEAASYAMPAEQPLAAQLKPNSLRQTRGGSKELAARHGLNHKTVAKWRKRAFVQDAPMGTKTVRSTVLSPEEEAIVVAFRRHTLLPLDDCLYALQATLPNLTRSSLYRCLKRHGISRLPEIAGDKPAKQPFKRYPIGYFHIDIAEVRTDEGKLHLFVAVDRTSKFAFAQLHLDAACPWRTRDLRASASSASPRGRSAGLFCD